MTNNELISRAKKVAKLIGAGKKIYAVPRGGVPAAYLIAGCDPSITIVDSADKADVIVDDIIDSGATRDKYAGKPFYALVNKHEDDKHLPWVVFPWEGNAENGIEDNIRRLLQYIGENPARGGLIETPKRVAKAWSFWCKGYKDDAATILKVFEDGAESCDQMVVVRDIPIYSHCEHHLAPIFGTCSIAYIPSGKIVGLSKLSRLADMFARRLQVQERLTNQIADALDEHLQPIGVGVIIRARHLCMESRGVCQQGHHTITSALRGAILSDPLARSEFMDLCK
jgi:GTP cyclohydrolase I